MKIIRVQYTTTKKFAAKNSENIMNITKELRSINHSGIKYGAYLLQDGKTFMHFDHFENEEAHRFLMTLESFKKFSTELWASKMESEPESELLSFLASSEDIF